MWRKISSFELHLFLWKDTHRHTTHSLLIIKMFSVTQTVTQSVRLNATVSKRDVTRRYEEVLLLVFSVCVGSIIRECILFFFISSFRHTSFFPINANAFGRARAKENDFFIPLNYKHHSPWKLLLFPPFVEKREFRVQKYAYPSVIIVLAIVNLIPVSGVELFLWWLILMGGRRRILLLLLRHHHYSLLSQIKEG